MPKSPVYQAIPELFGERFARKRLPGTTFAMQASVFPSSKPPDAAEERRLSPVDGGGVHKLERAE
jgi:hypothetical protein